MHRSKSLSQSLSLRNAKAKHIVAVLLITVAVVAVWRSSQLLLKAKVPEVKKDFDTLRGDLRLRSTYAGPDAIFVSLIFSTVLNTGGVESWFWPLYEGFFHKPPYVVYAVKCVDFWSAEVAAKLTQDGVLFNPGIQDIVEHSDVIIQTGSAPLPSFQFLRIVPRILVVHGGPGCNWTARYTRYSSEYRGIVGVSQASILAVPEADRNRAVLIPSAVNPKHLKVTMSEADLRVRFGLPDGAKILLFLGRISSEKAPQFFVDTVQHLPEDWVGVMVGPLYFKVSNPVLNSRTIMVGRWETPGDFLSIASVVLCPSPDEGGPIVLLESWAMRKPIMMRHTGLATQYPDGVFFVEPSDTPAVVAEKAVWIEGNANAEGVVQKIEAGFRNYHILFESAVVIRKWQDMMSRVLLAHTAQLHGQYELELRFLSKSHFAVIQQDGHTRQISCEFGRACTAFVELTNIHYANWGVLQNGFDVVCEHVVQSTGAEESMFAVIVDYRGKEVVANLKSLQHTHREVSVMPYDKRETVNAVMFRVALSRGWSVRISQIILRPKIA